jgi:hypothetical protein
MRKIIIFTIFLLSFNYILAQNDTTHNETKNIKKTSKKEKNSTLAMALSAVIPGAGQIYNGKYYEVPIIYGALYASYYLERRANWAYQAYRSDILLLQDTTRTGGRPVSGITDLDILAQKYNTSRRSRDFMIMVGVGVWVLNIIDAYIGAELSNFDVSDDLSLKIYPSVNMLTYNQPNINLTIQLKFK